MYIIKNSKKFQRNFKKIPVSLFCNSYQINAPRWPMHQVLNSPPHFFSIWKSSTRDLNPGLLGGSQVPYPWAMEDPWRDDEMKAYKKYTHMY